MTDRSEVLLIGGRSGVGKSTVGAEVLVQLSAAGVKHALIEGDNLDMAYPPSAGGLAGENLAAMWANYTALGYHRLIYINTACVRAARQITVAMGDDPRPIGVLLTSSDHASNRRLARREIGSALDWHVQRSRQAAAELDAAAPDWVARIGTDGKAVADIASEVIGVTGWRDELG